MTLSIKSTVELNNGVEMPLFGLGVYLTGQGRETQRAVATALEAGYRLIDTASMYQNEEDVGIAMRESGIPREEIFVTTKLWNSDHGYDETLKAFDASLNKFGLDFVDLYLIHWPVYGKRLDSWRALRKLLADGLCRAIGVSNYLIDHIKELMDNTSELPAVNQVEFSPFLYQKELLGHCHRNGIRLQAYCPLTRGEKFHHPMLVELSRKYGKSPAQILIRWCLEHSVIVIPKSANPDRIMENADVFDFSIDSRDMNLLDALNEDFRVSWDPTGAP